MLAALSAICNFHSQSAGKFNIIICMFAFCNQKQHNTSRNSCSSQNVHLQTTLNNNNKIGWKFSFQNCFVLYCIVLMGWSLLPNALRPSWDLLCPPNLGIRTWICRLNFAQRPICSGLKFFNEPEISDSGPPAQSPSRRNCAQDFYILKKSIDLSRVWTCKPWISRRSRYPETTYWNIWGALSRDFSSFVSPWRVKPIPIIYRTSLLQNSLKVIIV